MIKQRYKLYFGHRGFVLSVLISVLLLISSLVVNYYAGIYATHQASNAVTDIILSNVRVFDVDSLFVYGALFLIIIIAVVCLTHPQRIPFTLKSVSLFVLTRSIFTSLTHIGTIPTQIPLQADNILRFFTFGADYFFSGHTGLPFLVALIFWDEIYLRYLFMTLSVIFGAVVLLGHLHYSIDVLSAFFITYTIFHLSETFFAKDRRVFTRGLVR